MQQTESQTVSKQGKEAVKLSAVPIVPDFHLVPYIRIIFAE